MQLQGQQCQDHSAIFFQTEISQQPLNRFPLHFCTNVYDPHMMNPNEFVDTLTFLVPTAAENLHVTSKIL